MDMDIEIIFDKYKCNHYISCHLQRYRETIKYIRPYIKDNMNILNVGAEGNLFNELFYVINNTVNVENSRFDIRYDFITTRQKYDLIISLEVIEHLKDRDSTTILNLAVFNNSGLWNFFINCNRLLNIHGLLFITTPNINGTRSLYNLLFYDNPNMYKPHVKELSRIELLNYCDLCEFKIISYDTFNVWNNSKQDHPLIKKICELINEYDKSLSSDRNEDIFVLAEKTQDITDKDLQPTHPDLPLKCINSKLVLCVE